MSSQRAAARGPFDSESRAGACARQQGGARAEQAAQGHNKNTQEQQHREAEGAIFLQFLGQQGWHGRGGRHARRQRRTHRHQLRCHLLGDDQILSCLCRHLGRRCSRVLCEEDVYLYGRAGAQAPPPPAATAESDSDVTRLHSEDTRKLCSLPCFVEGVASTGRRFKCKAELGHEDPTRRERGHRWHRRRRQWGRRRRQRRW